MFVVDNGQTLNKEDFSNSRVELIPIEPPIAESEGFPYRLLTRLSPPSERRYWAVCLTLTGAPTANGSKFFLFVGCA